MVSGDVVYQIVFRCIQCGEIIKIFVKKSSIVRRGGIYRFVTIHKEPEPHIVIVDIDSYGFVVENYFIRYAPITRHSLQEIIAFLGIDNFSKLLVWLLLANKICFDGDQEIIKALEELINVMFCPTKKVDCKNADFTIHINAISDPPIAHHIIKRKVLDALKLGRELAISFMRHVLRGYLEVLEKLENIFEKSKRKFSLKELISSLKLDLTYDELKFLLIILNNKGLKISKMIDLAELRITGLVG